MIYFITEEGNLDYIKIGFTDNEDVRLRIATLQTGNPRKLILVKAIEGTYEHEQALHLLFANDKIRGEWFIYSEDIKRYLATTPDLPPYRKPYQKLGLTATIMLMEELNIHTLYTYHYGLKSVLVDGRPLDPKFDSMDFRYKSKVEVSYRVFHEACEYWAIKNTPKTE
jgi:hypothetical protein